MKKSLAAAAAILLFGSISQATAVVRCQATEIPEWVVDVDFDHKQALFFDNDSWQTLNLNGGDSSPGRLVFASSQELTEFEFKMSEKKGKLFLRSGTNDQEAFEMECSK